MHSYLRYVFIVFLLLFFASEVFAQFSYTMFNKRNHSELDWQIYRTENFDIVFHQRLESMAPIAGSCAEQIYKDLSVSLNVRFKERYSIFISDMDDISNGATVPFGYFFIWVNPGDYAKYFTGTDGWLRKVIAHEMVHALVMEKTRDWTSNILPISPGGVPGEVHEGMAQLYSGEPWGVMRGDSFMTLAVRDDNFSDSNDRIDNGGLLYGKGFSRIRLLKQRYSDKEIAQIFEYRNSFGAFSFEGGFKHVTGESYGDFCDDWLKDMNVYYNWREGLSERTSSVGTVRSELTDRYTFFIKELINTQGYVYTAIRDMDEPAKALYIFNAVTKKSTMIAESGILDNFSIDPAGKKIVFSRLHYGEHASIVPDIYEYEIATGNETQLTESLRASEPLFITDEILVFTKNDGVATNFYSMTLTDKTIRRLTDFNEEMRVYDLSLSRDKNFVFAAYFNAVKKSYGIGKLTIADGTWIYLTTDTVQSRYPLESQNGKSIVYTSYENDVKNLFSFDIESGEKNKITNQSGLLIATDTTRDGQLLCIAQDEREKTVVMTIDPKRVPELYAGTIKPYYSDWRFSKPDHEITYDPTVAVSGEFIGSYKALTHIFNVGIIPFPGYADTKLMPGVMTAWSDMLSKHLLMASIWPDFGDFDTVRYSLAYTNATTPLIITASYGATESSATYADTTLFELHRRADLVFALPWNAGKSFYANHEFSLGFIYDDYSVMNPSEFTISNNPMIHDGANVPPVSATESGIFISWKHTYLQPYKDIPHNSRGIRLTYMLQEPSLGSDKHNQRARGELFYVLPFNGTAMYAYGSFQFESGTFAPQKKFGINDKYYFNTTDLLSSPLFEDKAYVRGATKYIEGTRLLYHTVEWRVPLLQGISGQVFAEAAAAWDNEFPGFEETYVSATYGVELNFAVMGQVYISTGFAWDVYHPGEEPVEYWSIRKILPF